MDVQTRGYLMVLIERSTDDHGLNWARLMDYVGRFAHVYKINQKTIRVNIGTEQLVAPIECVRFYIGETIAV